MKLIIVDAYGVALLGGFPQTAQHLAKKFPVKGRTWQAIHSIMYTKYFNMAAQRKITQQQAWQNAINDLHLPISVHQLKKIHYSFMSVNMPVIKLLKALPQKKLLLSKNTRSQFADAEKLMHFRQYFDDVINTWELRLPKASKETLNYLLDRYKLQPKDIIYIDDQKENLVEAEKMGIHTIFYTSFPLFKIQMEKILKGIK